MLENKHSNKKIVYAGSDAFSVQPLKKLLNLKYKNVSVLTRPPKRQGRGMKQKNNPLADFALHDNLQILTPEKPNDNDFLAKLEEKKYDLLISCAYGRVMSEKLLECFHMGNINIHPSLLPRWRGPSPIESSILEGDKITGVSLMQMTEELDAGPVYEQRSISVNGENAKDLSEKLALLAGDMIESFLPSFFEGDAKPKQQDESLVTQSKIIKKEDARVDWNETSEVIDSKIKAYYPWPVAHTYLDDKYLRILDSEAIIGDEDGSDPGQIVDINKKGVIVKCKGGKIILKGIQPEGKKEMLAADFARGNRLEGRRFI
tara:strand:- start:7249 stop:8199 length:951 start_codon:yes stop_codon:yes gene_type:complete